jgi:hypothetical protein
MRTGIVLAGLLSVGIASAQETTHAAQHVDLDSVAALVVTVASCAALHSAAAEVLDREHLRDHAETARRRGEVDQLTAMYLLAQDRVAKGGTPQPLTSYTSYVEQLTAAARERMAALVSNADAAPFKREEDFCASFIPLEDEILGKISVDGEPSSAASAGGRDYGDATRTRSEANR